MYKPKKKAGIFGFIGLLALSSFVIFFILVRFYTLLIEESFAFENIIAIRNSIATAILAFIASIGGLILTVANYASSKIITEKFAQSASWFYLGICGCYTFYEIMMTLISPESRGLILPVYWSVTTLVIFFIMRKLLLLSIVKPQEGNQESEAE